MIKKIKNWHFLDPKKIQFWVILKAKIQVLDRYIIKSELNLSRLIFWRFFYFWSISNTIRSSLGPQNFNFGKFLFFLEKLSPRVLQIALKSNMLSKNDQKGSSVTPGSISNTIRSSLGPLFFIFFSKKKNIFQFFSEIVVPECYVYHSKCPPCSKMIKRAPHGLTGPFRTLYVAISSFFHFFGKKLKKKDGNIIKWYLNDN